VGKLKIAVPTKAHAGLEDTVSEVFGKAKTFTMADAGNGQVRRVRVIDNPAATYHYGSGLVSVKTLADLRVDLVTTGLDPGASGLLKHHDIREIAVKLGTGVTDVIRENFGRAENKKSDTSLCEHTSGDFLRGHSYDLPPCIELRRGSRWKKMKSFVLQKRILLKAKIGTRK
jgi:predicted Fe-Mo cluster-binding NifX family protein